MPEEKNSTCGRLPQRTQAPVAPTPPPTPATVSILPGNVCELRVVHAHPVEKVNDAEYYGYHADWLEIGKRSDDEYLCSYYYEEQPDWCTYESLHDSAIISNEETEYDGDDKLSTETFIVKHASAHQTVISAYHYFADDMYYEEYDAWRPHMMAPEVKIYNNSDNDQDQVGQTYTHPTNQYIPDLKKDSNGVVYPNEHYEGNMEIVINCSVWCWCTVESFKTSKGDVYADYRESGPSAGAQRNSNARSVRPLDGGSDNGVLRNGAN